MICCHGALVRLSGGNRQDGQMLSLTVSVPTVGFSLWYLDCSLVLNPEAEGSSHQMV